LGDCKKRIAFKKQLGAYFFINAFLWLLWWLLLGKNGIKSDEMPWPMWSTIGWGIRIPFSYSEAYHNNNINEINDEYKKLKDKELK